MADAKLVSESQEADINRISKLNAIACENYDMEVSALRDRNTRLSVAYDAEFALRQLHEEKALKYDRCNEDLKQLRREVRFRNVYYFVNSNPFFVTENIYSEYIVMYYCDVAL